MYHLDRQVNLRDPEKADPQGWSQNSSTETIPSVPQKVEKFDSEQLKSENLTLLDSFTEGGFNRFGQVQQKGSWQLECDLQQW